ncbi:ABC transporter permease subunit [Azoarcus communis]|uniref:ABC transporter permease n=1 Tax=Parazoarcus communis SWub3 = DSM 12120 TaxID=1121029 RepID=A0A323UVD4_9RHOO|nr:ABC transporter permease [Parazoarcus communis]NMG49102.1 ABC transporter permease subunit [Parazoarcus communis]NMG71071.1 ABC transporter permease subunit [Parazoarcus communis SWub3 = DSM 12120]PZA15226.1 ABC transporter permease [Azoarcus communis] [Parazoarcus communis SWub3 = DSM 12120]
MNTTALLARLRPLIGVVVLLAIWTIMHATRAVDPVLLPSPAEAATAFWTGITEGTLADDFFKTVVRTLWSFAIAVLVAVPLGIVFGASQKFYESIEFAIDFFRSTPASAMFPLFLVIFGVGELTKIAVAAFGAALVILFNVAYGVMGARKQRQLAARVMGAPRWRVLTDVTLLESMPQVFVGMRSGVSLALVIIIVAEMFIGSTDGLGQRVMNAQMIFDMPDMYVAIIAAGALGYAMNLVFILAERRFVHWGGK